MVLLQEPERAQQQLEQLLVLRERLTRDAKSSKATASSANLDSHSPALQQHQPLSYADALNLVLPFATSPQQAVQSATGKAANAPVPTTSAFEALDYLLLRAKAVLTAGAHPDELLSVRADLSLATLVSLSATLYTAWDNHITSAQQRLKSCLSTILALAAPTVLDFPQVARALQAKVLADAYDSKRGLQVFDVLLRHTAVDDYATFAAPPVAGEEGSGDDVREGVVRRFLVAMQQNEEMAPVIGKVALAWIDKCWASASASSSGDETWWVRPALAACRHGDARTRHMVTTYVLGGVFSKRKAAFRAILAAGGYLFDGDSSAASMDEQDLETSLALLKTGNALNLVELDASTTSTAATDKAAPAGKVALPTALLAACLHHSSTTLRTSALSLLVLSASSSLLFPLSTFPLLRAFYAYSLGDDEGEFRMSTISLTGRLFVRLRDSSWRANRTIAKGKDGVAAAQQYLEAAQAWIAWFLDLVARDNLNPARPYRIKMASLRMLDLALKARVDPRYRADVDGTAEAGKEGKAGGSARDATTGYSSYRKGTRTQTPSFQAQHRQIRDHGQARTAASSRPSTPSSSDRASSPSAAPAEPDFGWPFAIHLVNAATTQTLLRQLLSTYTALRHLVIATLERFPAPLPGYEGPEGAERAKRELLLPALRMIRSGREAEASAGAGIVGLVWRKWVLEGLEAGSSARAASSSSSSFRLGQVGGWQEGPETLAGPRGFAFISSLLDLIEQQLSHYHADLAQAAAAAPMHGTLLALRHLFVSIPPHALDGELLSTPDERRALFHRARDVVQRVWDVTSPVLAARAPEGGAADAGAEGEADNEEARAIRFEREKKAAAAAGGASAADVEGADDEEVAPGSGGVQHKIILSACWRAMKEAGELLETILRIPSELDTASFRQVWSYDEIRAIGELFGTWLRLARHRGTVANLHPCYTRCAAALLAAGKEWPEVGKLPERWLDQHLEDIVSARISITRRSAALPFIILGLLLTILPSSRPTFDAAFSRLFEIAESTTPDITDSSRVHGMNTIRTVFLDAKGGLAAAPYVERGFLVSISLFWSPNWICRNVALLLFATLITRAFNARRTNLERNPSSLAKRLTIDDFFGQYPSLEKVLLAELERGWRESQDAQASSNLHSPLFSILMLFSLLQTPRRIVDLAGLPTASRYSAPFLPIVKACAKSRVWKIRDAAGDALTGLVAPDEVGATAAELLEGIEVDRASMPVDELHGRLVQIQRLLEANVLLPNVEEKQASAVYLRLVPSILPPTATTTAALRPTLPYAILSSFLLIALRLPSTLSSASSPLADLTLSYLSQAENWSAEAYHLPSAEELLRSSWQVLFASAASVAEQVALAKGGVQARSIEVQRAALAALEGLGDAARPAAELLASVVLDGKYAGDVRVQAAELVRSLGGAGPASSSYQALAELHEETPIVPLREAVLPLLAGAARSEDERRTVLEVLRVASGVDESVESREAASLALLALSPHSSLPAALAPSYLHLVARLMQDDDPVVRENAERAFGARLVEGKAVERAVEEGGEATRDLLAVEARADFERDLSALENPTSLLFAIERSNIFIDFAVLDSLLLSSAPSSSSSEALTALRKLNEASKNLDEGPLGTGGNELVSRWARSWVQRLDVAQGDGAEQEEEAVRRLRGSA
ncbi:uncharacterized protein RHOBADRAFT_54083 [Rhodotorula graminis WP1]|uniref:Uncharacterized protein n=1 Tax=Rhodotorula graminis (strain WP1) TaxID=578459 RepID=A0A194S0U9_RHOGW|nr:uncharacterized protein RHOBADRAFT_54083 [Rhodotorula graminis WP1]KPV74232.1 hypothetical protein RHOBADRAFT_54083 [Rhodotorula graminis WP1]